MIRLPPDFLRIVDGRIVLPDGGDPTEYLRGWQKAAQVKDGTSVNALAHEFAKNLIFHYNLVSAA